MPNRRSGLVIHYAVAAFTTRRILQRECPVCGHVQIASPNKLRDSVVCERCDYHIPPRRKAA